MLHTGIPESEERKMNRINMWQDNGRKVDERQYDTYLKEFWELINTKKKHTHIHHSQDAKNKHFKNVKS